LALIDLWKKDPDQIFSKSIQQVIAFAGDGKLSDGSTASLELREYLKNIPSDVLLRYADYCLAESFQNSGLALQDIVNEIGRRIGFEVTPGYYRGTSGQPGHDGLWKDKDGHSILVEVKTTDAYRIDLNRIAVYRRDLEKRDLIDLERSSMLVIVGRQDTGDLEAQIRGSKYAWDMRVISVEALVSMMKLKEEVEDPSIIERIHKILVPKEFTRLDQIVDIAFAAVKDVKEGEPGDDDEQVNGKSEGRVSRVAFYAECVKRIESKLKISLIRQTRTSYSSSDGNTALICASSRFYEKEKGYWFGFLPYQGDFLSKAKDAYVAFGCGTPDKIFLIPYKVFETWLKYFNKTKSWNREYWHIKIRESGQSSRMMGRTGTKNFDLDQYLIRP